MNRLRFALTFALLVAGLGFFISRGSVLVYIATLDPTATFILSYVVLYVWILLVGLVLSRRPPDVKILKFSVALIILTFAFGVVLYWPASACAVLATGGNPATVPSFLLSSEDQVVCQGYIGLGITNVELLLFLTYVLTPFVLTFISVYIIAPQQARKFVRSIIGRV